MAGSCVSDHHVAGQCADALATHGVALVGHGRGADLVLLKGLFHLLAGAAAGAYRCANLYGALRDARQHVQHAAVHLARIGLAARPRTQPSKPIFLAMRLSSCVAPSPWSPSNSSMKLACVPVVPLAAQQAAGRRQPLCRSLEVHQQVLDPQRGALAHGGQLGGLVDGCSPAWAGPCTPRAKPRAGGAAPPPACHSTSWSAVAHA